MEITLHTTNLRQFRESLYQKFINRADTVMELLDAMCSVGDARTVVEYSLADCYRRSYSTIFKAIDEIKLRALMLPEELRDYLRRPKEWPFWLLMVDVTPAPRPYAHTLEDRGMVYQAEVVKGKLPVTIGHQYSTVAVGLEAEAGVSFSWALPLLSERVATTADKEMVGAEQIGMLLRDEKLPFGGELTVEVGDTSYSKPEYLYAHRQFANLVTVARVRGNRTFYQQYVPTQQEKETPGQGHPTWYGETFSLADPQTWTEPAQTHTQWETSRRGQRYRVEIQAWHNLLMTGKSKPKRLPMHQHPFTLLRIVRYDEEGNPLFKHPLWLLVMGERRHELTLLSLQQAYSSRFDLEIV